MRILVIGGSPHEHGSSNMLAGEFIRGAEEAGHEVEVFDAAKADLHPCIGCDVCGTAGPCTFDDDMTQLKDRIRQADLLAFVTPLYYFSVSTQLKCVIDRFYSFNTELASMRKNTALLSSVSPSMSALMALVRALYFSSFKFCSVVSVWLLLMFASVV